MKFLALFFCLFLTACCGQVYDSFDELKLKSQDPDYYWWILQQGNWGLPVNDFCYYATCVTQEQDGPLSFARLKVLPHPVGSYPSYTNAEIAEKNTGFAYDEPGIWYPETDHPVNVTFRVRWSENYDIRGGGAVGTSGLWLWNSPINYDIGVVLPVNSFGCHWVQTGAALYPIAGLFCGVFQDTIPIARFPMPSGSFDMQSWNVLTFVWTQERNFQTVTFYRDSHPVGTVILTKPMDPLSIEIWNDNQLPTFQGIQYINPPEEQSMDLDYVSIQKL